MIKKKALKILKQNPFELENTNTLSNISFWLMSPTAQTQYEDIYRKCMVNRGHSVLN